MARYINVEGHRCKVVESLGFNHDAGRRTSIVLHEGTERTAVYVSPGTWRFWTQEDRLSGGRASRVVGQ